MPSDRHGSDTVEPSVVARYLLRLYSRKATEFDFEKTLTDLYHSRLEVEAVWKLRLWFWYQTALSIAVMEKQNTKWRLAMILNYLKSAVRNMGRQRKIALLNIFGLSLGFTSAAFIMIWVYDEWQTDKFNYDIDQIYRVTIVEGDKGQDNRFAVSPLAMAPVIEESIPEIESAVRVANQGTSFVLNHNRFNRRGLAVSSGFFEVFNFPLLHGSEEDLFASKSNVAISVSMARTVFGEENVIGRVLSTAGGRDLVVKCVMQDVPAQSHFSFDFIRPIESLADQGRNLSNWRDISYYTYVKTLEGSDPEMVLEKIEAVHAEHHPRKITYELQPLRRLYLDKSYQFDMARHGNRQSTQALAGLAFAILLIASINFINLSTARAEKRRLEVGVRKVVGAGRGQLMAQFAGEALATVFMAAIVAMGAFLLLLSPCYALIGKNITLSMILKPHLLLSALGIVVLTGLVSGVYPALVLSGFRPVKLVGDVRSGAGGSGNLRRILTVFQFTVTIVVMIALVVVDRQLHYLSQTDLGYDRENLLVLPLPASMRGEYQSLKNELKGLPFVLNVSAMGNPPFMMQGGSAVDEWEGKSGEGRVHFKLQRADEDYLETLKIELNQGTYFRDDDPERGDGVVINEAAVRAMKMDEPVGRRMVLGGRQVSILGVVKDFYYRSLHSEVEPMALLYTPSQFYAVVLRLAPFALKNRGSLEVVESLWKRRAGDQPFSSYFLDDRLDSLYTDEQKIGTLLRVFSAVTLAVACIGLWGLAAFSSEQRTREMGLRKVMGASGRTVFWLLARRILVWVLLANLFAWPVGYLFSVKWLLNFAVRFEINIWIYIFSGMAAGLIAFAVVAMQTFRAAGINPIDALKCE